MDTPKKYKKEMTLEEFAEYVCGGNILCDDKPLKDQPNGKKDKKVKWW